MTNLMVIFVILWSLHQVKPTKQSTKTGDMTSHMVNLPGDVLFAAGKAILSIDGKEIFKKLFGQGDATQVLGFDTGGFTKRYMIIHGHTDGDGEKDDNFQLGFDRALATYRQMKLYSKEIPDHVILCSHADNTPIVSLPALTNPGQSEAVRTAKSKNRRITIEDKIDSRVQIE